jgi:hypothetical protein
MARRSILASAREERAAKPDPAETATAPAVARSSSIKPSRISKLHIGGYFDPTDPHVIAFQKLRVDLRKSQQEMLLEALRDFVAKHEAARAFL